ncbi:MAG: HD domain-containing protein [Candidatus Pacebacteria bacterium]|nr:HD domain-containing protein [Candidatus Paceibacterota bacterium]
MNKKQLQQIEELARVFYKKTGNYHDWGHVLAVKKHILNLLREIDRANENLLLAACYLHDIGRSVKDEGHPAESVRLASPLLKKVGLSKAETDIILDAIEFHTAPEICQAKTLEAKILFEADKLEILSVAGFLRTLLFVIEERKMSLSAGLDFLWSYAREVQKKYLWTERAKSVAKREMKVLGQVYIFYKRWQSRYWKQKE